MRFAPSPIGSVRPTATTRAAVSGAAYTLGVVRATAGALKPVFGVRVTVPFLPPLDLERVAIAPSLAVALFAVGAIAGRSARRREQEGERPLEGGERDPALRPVAAPLGADRVRGEARDLRGPEMR